MNECFEWPGTRTAAGYGRVRDKYAHRLIWEVVNGPIPDGMHVLHKCDNPPCVNPRHLFLGTHTENMHDMIAKGRSNDAAKPRLGVFCGTSKLTDAEVRAIRQRLVIGKAGANGRYRGNTRELAVEFGVTEATISAIGRRRAWKHVS
jgi:hypothetical protein